MVRNTKLKKLNKKVTALAIESNTKVTATIIERNRELWTIERLGTSKNNWTQEIPTWKYIPAQQKNGEKHKAHKDKQKGHTFSDRDKNRSFNVFFHLLWIQHAKKYIEPLHHQKIKGWKHKKMGIGSNEHVGEGSGTQKILNFCIARSQKSN